MRPEERREIFAMLALISQIGITMLVAILLCTFGGLVLDHKLDTTFLSVVGFFIGCVAGFRSVYTLVKKYIKNRNTRKTK